uniref:Uncharacterized protein n=1 Tax=uncultured prokaryote TaxID=198431 RepID=A0A0H5Q480_9ZZZZ|nr:hypothetical protein [uncultured prokaryote]
MAISKVTAVWSGFPGAPGYTNFFFNAFGAGDLVDLEVARVEAFMTAVAAWIPSTAKITVQPEVSFHEESTGELVGYSTAGVAPDVITGGRSGSYSSPVGGLVQWNTATIARGRLLKGRTFVVPMGSSAFDTDGSLASPAITALLAAANGLIGDGSGPELVVWSRPRQGVGGSIGTVTDARVPDKAVVLRSRRD